MQEDYLFSYPPDDCFFGGDISLSISFENYLHFCLRLNSNIIFPTIKEGVEYLQILNNQMYNWLKTTEFIKTYPMQLNEKIIIHDKDIEIYKNKLGYQFCIEEQNFNDIFTTYFWLKNVINNITNGYEKYIV